VKNNIREETVYITLQRMSLITLMVAKDSYEKGKRILELTEIFQVPA
jgi:hypothetical protein